MRALVKRTSVGIWEVSRAPTVKGKGHEIRENRRNLEWHFTIIFHSLLFSLLLLFPRQKYVITGVISSTPHPCVFFAFVLLYIPFLLFYFASYFKGKYETSAQMESFKSFCSNKGVAEFVGRVLTKMTGREFLSTFTIDFVHQVNEWKINTS